jgi:hypothetical protein
MKPIRLNYSLVPILCVLAWTHPAAQASVIVTIQESGGDIVETSSGTIDLIAFTDPSFSVLTASIFPAHSATSVGSPELTSIYSIAISGPASFGLGPTPANATSTSGDFIGFDAAQGEIFIATAYVSGTLISGSATFANMTEADIGVTPGTYIYTWGTADSATVNIIGSAPEPGTLWMGLGGVLLLAMFKFGAVSKIFGESCNPNARESPARCRGCGFRDGCGEALT